MNGATIAPVVLAAVAVVTLAGGMLALTYRVGRLVGRVETLITTSGDNYARLDRDITRVAANLGDHVARHRQGRFT